MTQRQIIIRYSQLYGLQTILGLFLHAIGPLSSNPTCSIHRFKGSFSGKFHGRLVSFCVYFDFWDIGINLLIGYLISCEWWQF
jgi:hypothetical protein